MRVTLEWDEDGELLDMLAEVSAAGSRFGPFHSTHEGMGVLEEERAELLDAIHANDRLDIRREALQVAAVAYRIATCLRVPATLERSCIAPHGAGGEDVGT